MFVPAIFVTNLPLRVAFAAMILGFVTSVTAQSVPQDNLNPTGAGCVDPQGYLDCYSTQLSQLTDCVKVANNTCSDTTAHYRTCAAGCDGAHLASKIGCWVQSCWNQMYSCEYQATVIQYLNGVDLVPSSVKIPLYPPPGGDMPGGCSCNIGNVFGNFSIHGTANECFKSAETGDAAILAECTCCQASRDISNVLHTCPKSDLTIMAFQQNLDTVQNTLSKSPDNCAILDHSDSIEYCKQTYGIEGFSGSFIYNPLNLPADEPGTEPLVNLPGTAFTSFVDVFTLGLVPGFTTTVTPAPFNAQNAGSSLAGIVTGVAATATGGTEANASPTVDPSNTGGVTSKPTGSATGTGTAASPTTSKPGSGSTTAIQISLMGYAVLTTLFCLL